jgi:LacI family transcriptional regulator
VPVPGQARGPDDPPAPARPTLAQVAAVSGVSLKTASRALNGEPNVAAATARKVQEAADLLGFRLNGIARELRRGAMSTLVGLVIGDLGNPFYARLANGIERELRSRGLQLITASTDEDPAAEPPLVNALLQRRVRALLIVPSSEDHAYLAPETRHGVPIVFVDRPPVGLLADAVLLDNRAGARAGVAHLLEQGHRRIALVGDYPWLSTNRDRVAGFGDAMRAAGVADWRALVHEGAHDAASAEQGVAELLGSAAPPTALFTTNNLITTGALRAVRGHRPPVGIVGFDDLEHGDLLDVTVVAYDAEEMGRAATRLALARIDGAAGPSRTVTMPTRLRVRGSSRPAAHPI